MKQSKENIDIKRILIFGIISFILSILLEVFVFNFYSIANQNNRIFKLDLTSAILNNCIFENGYISVPNQGGSIEFNNVNIETKNLVISFKGTDPMGCKGYILLTDEASNYSYVVASDFNEMISGKLYKLLRSNGNLDSVKICFENSQRDFVIEDISLNSPLAFNFNFVRFLGIFTVLMIFIIVKIKRLYLINLNFDNLSHKLAIGVAIMICIVLCLSVFKMVKDSTGSMYYDKYPLEASAEYYKPYVQQFDALFKKQLHLDVKPDEKMNELKNVYDPSERNFKDVKYLWDRAYYDGKYFSYFGIAPIIVLYIPFYIFTGLLPSDIFVTTFFALIAILFIFLSLYEICKTFLKSTNLLLFILVSVGVVFASLIYTVQSSADMYYIPVESGIAFMSVFIYLSFKAYNLKRGPLRILLFVLAGLSIGMLSLSRPNMLIVAGCFVLPIFLSVLIDNRIEKSSKLIDALSFLIPAALCGIGTAYYNYVRFGSIFEFGATYQLTVSDISYNKFRIENILPALYYYFIQWPGCSGHAPFLIVENVYKPISGNYFYSAVNIGLLSIPLNWSIAAIGPTLSRKEFIKSATYISILMSTVFIAILNFCLAGICIRYVCDISLPFAILSGLIILDANRNAFESGDRNGKIIYNISILYIILTIFICTVLIFINERCKITIF